MNKHPAHTPHYSLFSTQRHPTPQIRHSRAHRAHLCGTAACAVPSSGRRISGPRKRLFRIAGKAFPHIRRHRLAPQESPFRTVPPVFPIRHCTPSITEKPVPHPPEHRLRTPGILFQDFRLSKFFTSTLHIYSFLHAVLPCRQQPSVSPHPHASPP